jgi:hypothetical protein
MNIDGIPTRTLRPHPERRAIDIIDQTRLPHTLHWVRIDTLEGAAHAIRAMQVRGAPLIGATAAYGLAIALDFEASDARAGRGRRPASVDAPDRRQSALGAGPHGKPPSPLPPAGSAAPPPGPKPRPSPRKMWRRTPPSASTASSCGMS